MEKTIPGRRRATLGANKHYDDHDFIEYVRTVNVTPYVSQKSRRRSPRGRLATSATV